MVILDIFGWFYVDVELMVEFCCIKDVVYLLDILLVVDVMIG